MFGAKCVSTSVNEQGKALYRIVVISDDRELNLTVDLRFSDMHAFARGLKSMRVEALPVFPSKFNTAERMQKLDTFFRELSSHSSRKAQRALKDYLKRSFATRGNINASDESVCVGGPASFPSQPEASPRVIPPSQGVDSPKKLNSPRELCDTFDGHQEIYAKVRTTNVAKYKLHTQADNVGNGGSMDGWWIVQVQADNMDGTGPGTLTLSNTMSTAGVTLQPQISPGTFSVSAPAGNDGGALNEENDANDEQQLRACQGVVGTSQVQQHEEKAHFSDGAAGDQKPLTRHSRSGTQGDMEAEDQQPSNRRDTSRNAASDASGDSYGDASRTTPAICSHCDAEIPPKYARAAFCIECGSGLKLRSSTLDAVQGGVVVSEDKSNKGTVQGEVAVSEDKSNKGNCLKSTTNSMARATDNRASPTDSSAFPTLEITAEEAHSANTRSAYTRPAVARGTFPTFDPHDKENEAAAAAAAAAAVEEVAKLEIARASSAPTPSSVETDVEVARPETQAPAPPPAPSPAPAQAPAQAPPLAPARKGMIKRLSLRRKGNRSRSDSSATSRSPAARRRSESVGESPKRSPGGLLFGWRTRQSSAALAESEKAAQLLEELASPRKAALRVWVSSAGIDDEILTEVMRICKEGLIVSVDDLRQLRAAGELQHLFPTVVLLRLIQALDRQNSAHNGMEPVPPMGMGTGMGSEMSVFETSMREHIDSALDGPVSEEMKKMMQKFSSDVNFFVFGEATSYVHGLMGCIQEKNLERSIEQECKRNEDGKYAGDYEYVVNQRAREVVVTEPCTGQERVKDKGHDGWSLNHFCEQKEAAAAKLQPCHCAVIRMYTGRLYAPWNRALRALAGQAENNSEAVTNLLKWGTCITVLYEAIMLLAFSPLARFTKDNRTVMRGVDESTMQLPEEFTDESKSAQGFAGGVEVAFMSTTRDPKIAFDFSGGATKRGSIFEITLSAASRAANVKPFSMWPDEEELLFPPYTYLSFKSERHMGFKKVIRLDAIISTNRPHLGFMDLSDCTAVPECPELELQRVKRGYEEDLEERKNQKKKKSEKLVKRWQLLVRTVHSGMAREIACGQDFLQEATDEAERLWKKQVGAEVNDKPVQYRTFCGVVKMQMLWRKARDARTNTSKAQEEEPVDAPSVEKLPSYVLGVQSSDPAGRLENMTQLRKLLSVEQNPPIQQVINTGIVPTMVELLQDDENAALQVQF
jgi:hypothetical protein